MSVQMHRVLGLLLAVSLLSASGPSLARVNTTLPATEDDPAFPVQTDDEMPLGDADMPEGDFDLADDEEPARDHADADDSDEVEDDDEGEEDVDDVEEPNVDGEESGHGTPPTRTSGEDARDLDNEAESSSPPARRFVTTETTAGVAEPAEAEDGNATWWIAGAGVTLGVALLAGLAATTYILLDEFGLGTGSVTVTPR